MNLPLKEVSVLNNLNQKEGKFNTQAYVSFSYTCPPCPKGAQCKPCAPDFVQISEDAVLRRMMLNETEKNLIVHVNQSKQFQIGHQYKFSLEMKSHGLHFERGNWKEFKLLAYTEMN